MTDFPYYRHYLGDYHQKTKHLTLLEHGAYRLLIDHYYSVKGPIPNDPKKLFRICGARTPSERKAVLSTAAEFFIEDGTLLRHERCDSEIAKMLKKSKTNSANAQRTHSENEANDERNPLYARGSHSSEVRVRDNNTPSSAALSGEKGDFEQVMDVGLELLPDLAIKDSSPIRQWLNAGCDAELDIIPTIRRLAEKKPSSWNYFSRAVMDAKATRTTSPPPGVPRASPHATTHQPVNVEDIVNRFRAKGKLEE